MTGSWEAFIKEHARLRVEVEELRAAADTVGQTTPPTLKAELEKVYRFLSHRLLPHISVEERVLYPAYARAEGFRTAAETMRRDHAEIECLIREFAALTDGLSQQDLGNEVANEFRRVLYGLYAILKLHMEKEEQICLPALEEVLPPGRVRALMEGMELFDLAEQAAE